MATTAPWKRNLVLLVGLVAACSTKSKDDGATSSTTSPVPEDETASEAEKEHRVQQRALIETMRSNGILLPDYNIPEPDQAQVKADGDAAMADKKNREDFGAAIPSDLPIVDSQRFRAAGQSSLLLQDVTEQPSPSPSPDPAPTDTDDTTDDDATVVATPGPCTAVVAEDAVAALKAADCLPDDPADPGDGGGGGGGGGGGDKDCPVVCATASAYASAFACAYAEAWACVWTFDPFASACSYFRSSACTTAFSSMVQTVCTDGKITVTVESSEAGVTIEGGVEGGVGVSKSKAH